jgi:hypothetical protein
MKPFKESRNFLLFPARTTLGWRVIRRVSFCEGETRVRTGDWRRVLDSVSRDHVGYQVCAPEMSRGDYEIPSAFSPASITAREAQINAGLMGESRTARLSEDKRAERRVMEDRVERVRAKVVEFGRRRLVEVPRVALIPRHSHWDAFPGLAGVEE